MDIAWFPLLAVASLVVAGLSAAVILIDEIVGRRQMMPIMKIVWPVTALYLGPLALWAYATMGPPRALSTPAPGQRHEPMWQAVFKAVTHCGSGCTLGDIVGEWTIFLLGATIAGIALWPEYLADFALAFALGILFQYFTIAPMRHLGVKAGLIAALKADTLSLTAFEVGLFGWMALMQFVFFHPHIHPNSPVYWFMMQIGMVVGFITSYPMNWWLVQRGIKERM